jgi:predicted Zn-dependent protease
VGERIVQGSDAGKTDWQFSFTMLKDEQTVNAFALPGGPTFMTMALFNDIMDASNTDAQAEARIAGVMAHEIGHVVARHSAQRLAKQQLTQGLTGAAVLATYDPNNPNSQASQAAIAMIGNLVNMKYGRDDELEADRLGVRFMGQAGYDPCELIGVMEILESVSGGARQPEFLSTHPSPTNRVQEIEAAVQTEFGRTCP